MFIQKRLFEYLLGQIEILYSLALANSFNYHLLAIIELSGLFQISSHHEIWSILEGQTVSGLLVGIAGFKQLHVAEILLFAQTKCYLPSLRQMSDFLKRFKPSEVDRLHHLIPTLTCENNILSGTNNFVSSLYIKLAQLCPD